MTLLPRLGYCLLGLVLAAQIALPGSNKGGKDNAPTANKEKAAELKKLVRELRNRLENARASMVQQAAFVRFDVARILELDQKILKYAIEYEDDPKERLAALRKCQRNAQQILADVKARAKGGGLSQVDVDQAEALILECRIAILREELKTAKRP
jgi:hypothetical protein